MWRDALHHLRSRRFRASEMAVLAVLLGFVIAVPTLGTAATCSTVGSCKAGSKIATFVTDKAVGAAISLFQYNVEYMVDALIDRLTRASNNDSQSTEAHSTAALNSIDPESTASTAMTTGAARFDIAQEMIPSTSVCAMVSRNMKISSAEFNPARLAQYETSQRDATDYAANKPGGPTANGAIQASGYLFKDLMNGFCDSSAIVVPSGVSCTQVNDSSGRPMAWRYTQPQDALFSRETLPNVATDPENRAARLFARMVIEPVPPDPIRGPMLIRQEGKDAFLNRQRDIAATNLARGVLDRMVDDRITDGTSANPSLEQLRRQAWEDANLAYQDSLTRAGQGEETNIRDIAALSLDINRIYLQVYYNLERMAVIKATILARSIQQQNSGGASAAGRLLQRQ